MSYRRNNIIKVATERHCHASPKKKKVSVIAIPLPQASTYDLPLTRPCECIPLIAHCIECVYRYSVEHKGYRCRDPTLRQMRIYRVCFWWIPSLVSMTVFSFNFFGLVSFLPAFFLAHVDTLSCPRPRICIFWFPSSSLRMVKAL